MAYSCIGVWQHDRVEIIANDQGNRTTPSVMAFIDTKSLIGDAAKNQKLEMRGQDLRPPISSLKCPRFPDSDSDDAVTILGDTIKRQMAHDSDDGLLAMEDSIRELDNLLHHKGSSCNTTEAYDCWT
ncbi:hypothetical protein FF1_035717 [Malus domestica]